MKRSEYLIPLSRDHHTGLLFCWKIRTGINKGVDLERISKYIDYYWNAHLKFHFEEEEQLLPSDEMDEQHVVIRQQVAGVLGRERHNVNAYLVLEEMINTHIRFEERELFPLLENELSAEQLKEIGKTLHEVRFKDEYKDEFWV
jgi:hemerythrin-like domain-containing protein